MKQPRKSYFLCSTPRSGSTLLCHALQQTGKLGAPDEFFSPDSEARWGAEPDALIRQLIAERTVNGVFGIKAHFNEFMPLYLSKHMEWLRPAKYVFLDRGDKVAQGQALHLDGRYKIDDGTTVSWSAVLEQVLDFEFQGPLVHDRKSKRRGWADAKLSLRLSPDENVLAGTTTPEGGVPWPFVLARPPRPAGRNG